ncbi:MAG: magnesium chelatase domain-containing protein, partial [Dysosmobacter welbionis]
LISSFCGKLTSVKTAVFDNSQSALPAAGGSLEREGFWRWSFMVVTVRSLGLNGIAGYAVSAECFLSGGLPAFDIVGLPDAAVREARERVRAAVKNCGAKFPVSQITVRSGPGRVEKGGHSLRPAHLCGAAGRRTGAAAAGPASGVYRELSLTGALRASPACCPWPWQPGTPV